MVSGAGRFDFFVDSNGAEEVSILQRAHLHDLALNLAGSEFMHGVAGDVTGDGDVGRLIGDRDLADIVAGELARARQLGSERAEDVAGADFFLASAENLQRHHRWHQRLIMAALQ